MEEYEKTLIQLSGKDFLVLFYDFLVFSMLISPFFYFSSIKGFYQFANI